MCHIQRQVADNQKASGVGIGKKSLPLTVEGILTEHIELCFFRKLFSCNVKCKLISLPELPAPLYPWCTVMLILECSKQGIIIQPIPVVRLKYSIFYKFSVESFKCFLKHSVSVLID